MNTDNAPFSSNAVAAPTVARASAVFVAAYLFAQFGNWLALLTPVSVTIALRVAQIADPAEKAAQLGMVLSIGAVASIIATPIWGQLSDQSRSKIGRRKLWMIVGVFGGGGGLLVMSAAPNMIVFGLGWVIAQIAFNANQAALNALLPERIPEQQRGRVAGMLGLTSITGALVGVFITQYTIANPYLLFLAPWFGAVIALAVILAAFKDGPAPAGAASEFTLKTLAKSFWVSPREHPDFFWAWASRFLVILGVAYLQTYAVYFLSDHLKAPMADLPTLIFYSSGIGAAITLIVSPLGGWLSDKVGRRKPFVLFAAIVGGAGLLIIGAADNLTQFFVGSAITSLGVGVYYAVDLALVAAVLPDPNNSAKDMGVFQAANTLPQSLAPAIAPLFLAIGGVSGGNYAALFIAAAAFAILGAFAIIPVRGTR